MNTKKTTARENALKYLYSKQFDSSLNPESCLKHFNLSTNGKNHFIKILDNINEKEFNSKIKEVSKNWTISRIYSMDLIIIHIALSEQKLLINKKIIISESLKLADKYSTSSSKSFLNGILDKIL